MEAPAIDLLAGFGRASRSTAAESSPGSLDDIAELLAATGGRGAIGRGLGRSYGDAALNDSGSVLNSRALEKIIAIDLAGSTVDVEAGVSLGELLAQLAPLGWGLPVVPATRHVTVGGAIAADVHGKNHHRVGSIGGFVERFTLVTPTGTFDVSPDSDRELFDATTGGMGLTGMIADARLRIRPSPTTWLTTSQHRAGSVDQLLEQLSQLAATHEYTVAWIDALAGGKRLGRGIAIGADTAPVEAVPESARARRSRFVPRHWCTVPAAMPVSLLNRASVAALNHLWMRKVTGGRPTQPRPCDAILMPLDAVTRWNHLYGPHGLVQYQFVVPDPGVDLVRIAIERLQQANCPSYFATLKRLGQRGAGPLSFPLPGWSLSVDVPARRRGLGHVLDDLDEQVAAAGGRVYLAKDSRLRADVLERMYPELDRFRRVCDRVDPDRVMQSDLSRRLHLR